MAIVLDIYVKGHPKAQPRARHTGMAMVLVERNFVKKWTTKPQAGDVLVPGADLCVVPRTYNPDTADAWKDAIVFKAQQAHSVYTPDPKTGHRGAGKLKPPVLGAIRCDLTFFFQRPQYMLDQPFKYGRDAFPYPHKPDRDNLEKAVLDALTEAGIWEDDSQVTEGEVQKLYSGIGGAAGVKIVVETLAVEEQPELFAGAGAAEGAKR